MGLEFTVGLGDRVEVELSRTVKLLTGMYSRSMRLYSFVLQVLLIAGTVVASLIHAHRPTTPKASF